MARHVFIKGYRLRGVSGACPESYDVFRESAHVGHLRQNAGHFTAEVHGVRRAAPVYEVSTIGDGTFDECERERHLTRAVDAIDAALRESGAYAIEAG